jgi:hypothetical protein
VGEAQNSAAASPEHRRGPWLSCYGRYPQHAAIAVASGTGRMNHEPEMLYSAAVGSVYRENTGGRHHASTRRLSSKKTKRRK